MTRGSEWVDVRIQTALDAGELLGVLDAPTVTGAWQEDEVVHLYWPAIEWTPDEAARLRGVLVSLGAGAAAQSFVVQALPAEDWNARWARSVKPVHIGSRVVVRPSWEPALPAPDRIDLVIDPKLAFGTGHHATTQLLVEWLEQEIHGGEAVLDIGTGTGILAMVALRLGARRATGWDHDPQAVEYARGYARENGFGTELTLSEGAIEPYSPALDVKWDVVLANLDRQTLMSMAESLGRLGERGATLLVSGLLREHVPEIRDVFARQHLYHTEQRERDGWVALRLQAPASCEDGGESPAP